jgi:hypothetical protein
VRERERAEGEVKLCSDSGREKIRMMESANVAELTALTKDLDDQVTNRNTNPPHCYKHQSS